MLCNAAVRRAVLLEPQLPAELAPLSADESWSGMSLVNHRLIDRHLEELAHAGIREVCLSWQPEATRAIEIERLGSRWGLAVAFQTPPAREGSGSLRGRLRREPDPILVLRIDCWPGASGLRALLFGSCMPARRLAGPAGPLPCFVSPGGAEPGASLVYCRDAVLIETLTDYWQASIELLGRLGETNHLERALEEGRYVGAGARVHPSAQIFGPCLVGSGAWIGKRCVIGANSIVCDGAYLDTDVRVTDSVILGDCHINRGAELHGVIVAAGEILCWRSGRFVEFDHTVVLANQWAWQRGDGPRGAAA